MNIAIIEYKNDLPQALSSFSPHDTLFLSVSAEASYYLSKSNIKFLTDEEIMSSEEFIALGNENFKITENWTIQLDNLLNQKSTLFNKEQFYPFKWHFYRLKILLDAVRIRKILIERLIIREKPQVIGKPIGTRPDIVHDHHLFFYKSDSLYGLIVERIADVMGIRVQTWEPSALIMQNQTISSRIRVCRSVLKNGYRRLKALMETPNSRSEQDNILVGSMDYDIAPLKENIAHRFNFYFNESPFNIRSLDTFKKLSMKGDSREQLQIDVQNVFKTLRVTGDPIIDEIIGERIQSYAEKFIGKLWKGIKYLEYVDSKKHFKGFIHPVGASDVFYGIPVYHFMKQKKPVFVIQHGSYGYALNNITAYSEFGHNGYFLAWGDGVKKLYEGLKKGDCEIFSTGSHLIEEIRKKRKQKKAIKKVCYVPGIYRGYTAYYPGGQPCLDSKLFVMETDFLTTLKPYTKRYDVTYKVAPSAFTPSPIFGTNPMINWVKENLPDLKISAEPLLSVIHDYDLFIIDWPTTTLIQTLATGAEVIVYAGNPYYVPTKSALEMLKERAMVGLDEDGFKEKIAIVLEGGEVISDVENTTFLKEYGVYLDDGKSLQRMTDKIISTVLN
jgi:hypothetical protein